MLLNNAKITGITIATNSFFELVGQSSRGTDAIDIVEYASRLCYDSINSFGTNTNFLKGLVKAGHMDVFEHATIAAELTYTPKNSDDLASAYRDLFYLQKANPFMRFDIEKISDTNSYTLLLSANLRALFDFSYDFSVFDDLINTVRDMQNILYNGTNATNINIDNLEKSLKDLISAQQKIPYLGDEIVETTTGARVTLLGYMIGDLYEEDGQEVYLFNNVSRAFTHQHVRHRLLSHSQMSQRYVDFQKKGDGFVYPTDIDEDERELLDKHFGSVANLYSTLRASKMKKEDARCILPNAAVTHIVSSAFWQPGLLHYLELRTASDAQEEIRLVAQAVEKIHKQLYHYGDVISDELFRSGS